MVCASDGFSRNSVAILDRYQCQSAAQQVHRIATHHRTWWPAEPPFCQCL